MATRYRATFLLQVLILVASVAGFLALRSLFEGPPLAIALIVFVAWYVAVQLEALPRLVEWWVLRWAARHAPAGSILPVDAEAGEERRRNDEDDTRLW